MDTLNILFNELWPTFIGALICIVIVRLVIRSDSGVFLLQLFLHRRTFTELDNYSKDEQRLLLHEALKDAFRNWRTYIPSAVFAFIFAASSAIASTIPKVTTISDSWWVGLVISVVVFYFGIGLAFTLSIHYVRPFLQACLVRLHHAA